MEAGEPTDPSSVGTRVTRGEGRLVDGLDGGGGDAARRKKRPRQVIGSSAATQSFTQVKVNDGKSTSHLEDGGFTDVVYGVSGFEEDDRFGTFAKVMWATTMIYVLGMFVAHGPFLLSEQGIAVSTCTSSAHHHAPAALPLPGHGAFVIAVLHNRTFPRCSCRS